MKSRIVLLLLLSVLCAACAEHFLTVTVPFTVKKITDFSAYDDVFFIDFICDVPDADIDAGAEIGRVFSEEIPYAVGKKIVRLDPEHWAMILGLLQRYGLAVDIQYENSVFFHNVFQAHPRALFFTGKLKLNIKKMGVVKETRDEAGNKKNAYETLQLWEMNMNVSLIEGDSSKVLWQEAYTEKAEPGPETSPQFNFNSMLAKITAKLTATLQPRKELQERFILNK
jgi:hypothetical protein